MIRIDDLSFAYHSNKVFDGLSFSLEQRPVTALLGLNGEGKTTFIKLLLGLLKPDKGSILIDGQNIDALNDQERSRLL
ncbi:MAG: ABC transporter ATP-binding protein, partial [Erysipelotrichaceae bacterium]|nr:ABC transporter ATP-binding protein [Erysipelotrichaceae bacterium]